MASNQGQGGRSAGLKRLALLAFASLLVLLFLGFAIAQGIGQPSPSSGEVAIVEDAPEGTGTITEEDLDKAIERTAGQSGQPVPKPDDPAYDELKEAALESLLDVIWIQGEAEEMGISVTPEEVSKEFEKLKGQAFKTEKEYQKYLKESHFTQADVDEQVKVQILSEQIQEQVSEAPGEPSEDEIEDYYEAAKAEMYTKPPSRDVRLILNKEEEKAEKALAALEEGNTSKDWTRIAKEYSDDPVTREKGGLQEDIIEGGVEEPVGAAMFEAAEGQLEGPIKAPRGFYVFEVQSAEDESVEPLEKVEDQITSALGEKAQEQASAGLLSHYTDTWSSRTFCAADFIIERCANFEGDGRPLEAIEACYEADPKEPTTDCQAPVAQAKPAVPGSVTPLEPEGTRLAQRPIPVGFDPEAPAAEPTSPTLVP